MDTSLNVSKDGFRAVMRQLAGGVCVITAQKGDKLFGLTSTAVASVCADPPTLLVGINQSTRTHDAIRAAGTFAVNLLAEGQSKLSALFASQSDAKFQDIVYENRDGCPVLAGTCGFALCRVSRTIEEGSHSIFLGRILKLDTSVRRRPLVYHGGQYGSFLQATG